MIIIDNSNADLIATIVNDLRNVKQRVYNAAVEGNPEQPADVVDTVVYAIRDNLEELIPGIGKLLYNQVTDFYPDYIEDNDE
jgi:hypothetical protein